MTGTTVQSSRPPRAARPSPRPVESDPAIPDTMRAAVQHRYGNPEDVIRVTEVPVPQPAAHEVLVRVMASSMNALDWHVTTGLPMFSRPAIGLRRPKRTIPGVDVAGVIAAVGGDVTRFAVGDEVFGQVDGGGFAQYVTAPADWLVTRPQALSMDQAATLGLAAQTALQGLRDWGGLREGQRVLINGASGGVGSFAVQIAQALGAGHVTAVCSTGNVQTATRLGADVVIDYTRQDATAGDARYDVIFDNAGVWPLRACNRMLADGGVYVMITAPKSRWLRPLPRMLACSAFFSLAKGRTAGFRVARRSTEDLELLADLAQRGLLRPVLERSYPLQLAAEALLVQGEFHARGKSVIHPWPAPGR